MKNSNISNEELAMDIDYHFTELNNLLKKLPATKFNKLIQNEFECFNEKLYKAIGVNRK